MYVLVNQKPSIGECFVKLYAKPSPSEAERVVGTATCAAEDLDEPLTTWVGDGLDLDPNSLNEANKGITKIEVNWKAEYTDPLPMPSRPTSTFFVKNAPVTLGIAGGGYTITSDGK